VGTSLDEAGKEKELGKSGLAPGTRASEASSEKKKKNCSYVWLPGYSEAYMYSLNLVIWKVTF
jgi:hypothetical protein